MYKTILSFLLGFLLGIFSAVGVLVGLSKGSSSLEPEFEFPEPEPEEETIDTVSKLSPRKKAGIMRTFKMLFFYILGYVLAFAGVGAAQILGHFSVNDTTIQVVSIILASITGGLYKVIDWKDAGVDVSTLPFSRKPIDSLQ